jgi:hypothetical protein
MIGTGLINHFTDLLFTCTFDYTNDQYQDRACKPSATTGLFAKTVDHNYIRFL